MCRKLIKKCNSYYFDPNSFDVNELKKEVEIQINELDKYKTIPKFDLLIEDLIFIMENVLNNTNN